MAVSYGIDGAEAHHGVALVNEGGTTLAKLRISDDAEDYRRLLEVLAEHGDTAKYLAPDAIETGRSLLVAALRTGQRTVYAINPLAAARYRDRHSVSRNESGPGDALVLANILHTDMAVHRTLPADSEQVQTLAVMTHLQQDAVWARQQLVNEVRSLLR